MEGFGSASWVSRPFPLVTCPRETFLDESSAAVEGTTGARSFEAVMLEVRKAWLRGNQPNGGKRSEGGSWRSNLFETAVAAFEEAADGTAVDKSTPVAAAAAEFVDYGGCADNTVLGAAEDPVDCTWS